MDPNAEPGPGAYRPAAVARRGLATYIPKAARFPKPSYRKQEADRKPDSHYSMLKEMEKWNDT